MAALNSRNRDFVDIYLFSAQSRECLCFALQPIDSGNLGPFSVFEKIFIAPKGCRIYCGSPIWLMRCTNFGLVNHRDRRIIAPVQAKTSSRSNDKIFLYISVCDLGIWLFGIFKYLKRLFRLPRSSVISKLTSANAKGEFSLVAFSKCERRMR